MILESFYIYKCPNCGNLISRESYISGNTFGAQIFSDGKIIAPMHPLIPNLTKCKKCETIFWLSKLKEIGTFGCDDCTNYVKEWKESDCAAFLDLEDNYNALDKGLAENKEEELNIRISIWWEYNNRIREGENIFRDEKDELRWTENLERLKTLLDQSDIDQRMMIAEINRNLGDFENCISVIQTIDDDEVNRMKEKILNECHRKNKWVVELDNDN